MCGIAGFWSPALNETPESVLKKMTSCISKRGPDADGHWLDIDVGLALGHRRLSILDLSEEGSQPMHSASGRYTLIFNGEIYNYRDIQKRLTNTRWRGHSDTEVVLAGFEEWGIEATIRELNGMFAMAIWDKEERDLILVRDRLGIKPLYYGKHRGSVIFGSVLSPFHHHPDFEGVLSSLAISSYIRYGYIPEPLSIYEGVSKLPPGTILKISSSSSLSSPINYWSASEMAKEGQSDLYKGSKEELVDDLDVLLNEAVSKRMISDVPLGAFLSGGIDSSTVVSLMQANSASPVKSFSIGFDIEGFNEANYAKEVAKHLGTDHTELYCTARDSLDIIPKLAGMYDEPFADQSQIPTYLVSRLARSSVTVSLSGDGGDELFAGYDRYAQGLARWEKLEKIPHPIRSARILSKLLANRSSKQSRIESEERRSRMMSSKDLLEFYHRQISVSENLLLAMNRDDGRSIALDKRWEEFRQNSLDSIHQIAFCDLKQYLPDDILTKVDRASMAVSLEARVPLLDHEIVEFAFRVPSHLKNRDGMTKWPLQRVLEKYVPRTLFDRPKMGFGVPVGSWMKEELKEWVEELLEPIGLEEQGIFSSHFVQDIWDEHKKGEHDWTGQLWRIVAFQNWLQSSKLS